MGEGFRLEKCTWENAAAFEYDVYEGFQRKEPTVAVAVDLENAHNRVQFKVLMDLLMQYRVSLTLTRWIAGAPPERTGYAAWELAIYSSSAYNGPTTRITALAGPF